MVAWHSALAVAPPLSRPLVLSPPDHLAPPTCPLSLPPGFHEFSEFVAEDVGTVDSGLNSMVRAAAGYGAWPCECVRRLTKESAPARKLLSQRLLGCCPQSHKRAGCTGARATPQLYTCYNTGVSTQSTQVLANNEETILMPVNEPTFGTPRKSQIQTYLEQNEGPGLQHLALLSNDIFTTLR